MNTKLTISLNKEVIEKAKVYAKNQDRSLSNLIETFLCGITHSAPIVTDEKSTPITDNLRGSFKTPKDIDYKEILREEKLKKYG